MLSNTATQLLTLLADGAWHSGEQLGNTLGISRSAIWKATQQLKHLGLDLHSVTRTGHQIRGGIELLDTSQIRANISADNVARLDQMLIMNQVTSTNDHLLALASQQQTLACFAEQQTQGKGRRGRHWVSPFGSNIYHSLLWHFNKDPAETVGLSLAAAVAVVKALEKYGIKDLQLKWPNDILVQQQKLSGVLLEMLATPHEQCSIVIGVGINTQMSATQSETIEQAWTSIEKISGCRPQRNHLAGLLLNELISTLITFEEKGLAPFLADWLQYDMFTNQAVTVIHPQGNIQGVMQGVSERGELILREKNGDIRLFLSGEVSLRR